MAQGYLLLSLPDLSHAREHSRTLLTSFTSPVTHPPAPPCPHADIWRRPWHTRRPGATCTTQEWSHTRCTPRAPPTHADAAAAEVLVECLPPRALAEAASLAYVLSRVSPFHPPAHPRRQRGLFAEARDFFARALRAPIGSETEGDIGKFLMDRAREGLALSQEALARPP